MWARNPVPATALYNQAMQQLLPQAGVQLTVFPRKSDDGTTPISASRVRALLKEGNLDAIKPLVSETTYAFLVSEEGQRIAENLRNGK